MITTLTKREASSLSVLVTVCCGIIANSFQGDGEPLIVSVALSGVSFAFTYCLIRWLGDAFIRAGLKGKDMSKLKKPEMYVCYFLFYFNSFFFGLRFYNLSLK